MEDNKLTIKQWRMLHDMSQEELAQKLNVHANTIRNWEQNSLSMQVGDALKIAEVFGISMEKIFFE